MVEVEFQTTKVLALFHIKIIIISIKLGFHIKINFTRRVIFSLDRLK